MESVNRWRRAPFILLVAGATLLVVGVPIGVIAIPNQACGMDEFECNTYTPKLIAVVIVVLASAGLALVGAFIRGRRMTTPAPDISD
jgi:flagellar biosynthesis protein FliQ